MLCTVLFWWFDFSLQRKKKTTGDTTKFHILRPSRILSTGRWQNWTMRWHAVADHIVQTLGVLQLHWVSVREKHVCETERMQWCHVSENSERHDSFWALCQCAVIALCLLCCSRKGGTGRIEKFRACMAGSTCKNLCQQTSTVWCTQHPVESCWLQILLMSFHLQIALTFAWSCWKQPWFKCLLKHKIEKNAWTMRHRVRDTRDVDWKPAEHTEVTRNFGMWLFLMGKWLHFLVAGKKIERCFFFSRQREVGNENKFTDIFSVLLKHEHGSHARHWRSSRSLSVFVFLPLLFWKMFELFFLVFDKLCRGSRPELSRGKLGRNCVQREWVPTEWCNSQKETGRKAGEIVGSADNGTTQKFDVEGKRQSFLSCTDWLGGCCARSVLAGGLGFLERNFCLFDCLGPGLGLGQDPQSTFHLSELFLFKAEWRTFHPASQQGCLFCSSCFSPVLGGCCLVRQVDNASQHLQAAKVWLFGKTLPLLLGEGWEGKKQDSHSKDEEWSLGSRSNGTLRVGPFCFDGRSLQPTLGSSFHSLTIDAWQWIRFTLHEKKTWTSCGERRRQSGSAQWFEDWLWEQSGRFLTMWIPVQQWFCNHASWNHGGATLLVQLFGGFGWLAQATETKKITQWLLSDDRARLESRGTKSHPKSILHTTTNRKSRATKKQRRQQPICWPDACGKVAHNSKF